jgi:shikimate kinase
MANEIDNNSDKPNLIFFIGFMGCGKTTWSRKLANHLGYEFVDLDHLLEEKIGMTIAEYFPLYGEEAFRKQESELLKNTTFAHNTIISTGGGLPVFFDHMDWMNANGKTVYIKLSPKTLVDRLEKGKAKRPLLRDKEGDELLQFITDKLAEREGFYLQASHIADGISLSVEGLEALINNK